MTVKTLEDDDPEPQLPNLKTPSAFTTREYVPKTPAPPTTPDDEKNNGKWNTKNLHLKKRAKTAAKKTQKVVTSSYTCAVCITISGAVTMICGILMLVIGTNNKAVQNETSGRDFMLIGGSIFFLFGFGMIVIAVVYTVVHYLRKRAHAAKDPFAIKREEKKAREREKAQQEGKVVVEKAPVVPLPVACSAEHEHDSVLQQRIKETRRQSLFMSTSQSSADVTQLEKKPPPLKKARSAFQFSGFGKLPPIKPAADNDVKPMTSTNDDRVKEADGVYSPVEQLNSGSAGVGRGMRHSQSAVDMFSVEHSHHSGHLAPLSGARRGSAMELTRLGDGQRKAGKAERINPLHTITDVTDFDSDI